MEQLKKDIELKKKIELNISNVYMLRERIFIFIDLYKSIKIIINLKVIIYFNNNVNMKDKTF
jgi:hypothetical protein